MWKTTGWQKLLNLLSPVKKTFRPNFVVLFVFCSTASFCILDISDSDAGELEFTPAVLFCLDHALFTPWGVNSA